MAPAAAEAPPAAAAPESGADVLEALANLLRARSNANPARRDEPLPSSSINYFMASRAADISVEDYLRRLLRFFECSQSCLVLVAIYVDRVLSLREDVEVSERTVHRLILASLTVATKFNDDRYFSNAWYAKIGGVSNLELNCLEAELLRMIDWRARVSPEEFDRYRGLLLAPASGGRAPQPAGGAPGAPAATPQAASLHKAAPPPKAACRSRQASRQDSRRRARSDGGGCAPGGRARASVSPGLRLVRRARRFYQPLGTCHVAQAAC